MSRRKSMGHSCLPSTSSPHSQRNMSLLNKNQSNSFDNLMWIYNLEFLTVLFLSLSVIFLCYNCLCLMGWEWGVETSLDSFQGSFHFTHFIWYFLFNNAFLHDLGFMAIFFSFLVSVEVLWYRGNQKELITNPGSYGYLLLSPGKFT